MTTETIAAAPITAHAFSPYGNLVSPGEVVATVINEGRCKRYTDLADLDVTHGRIGLSLFEAEIRTMPYRLSLLERHPKGSQCFVPMGQSSFLVIVAEDNDGVPVNPNAFLAGPNQPVNIARNIWHGVLTPISGSGLFAVIDAIDCSDNLEEYRFETPITIVCP